MPRGSAGLEGDARPAAISVVAPGMQATVTATLVALEFDAPQPALLPGKKSRLDVLVRGSEQKLALVVENVTPGVLRFLRGDSQEVVTRGGPAKRRGTRRAGDQLGGLFLSRAADSRAGCGDRAAILAWRRRSSRAEDSRSDIRGYAKRMARHPRDVADRARASRRSVEADHRGGFSHAAERRLGSALVDGGLIETRAATVYSVVALSSALGAESGSAPCAICSRELRARFNLLSASS